MIYLINDLVINVALISFFVLISLFCYKRLSIEIQPNHFVKKYLFVIILASIASYWVTLNGISFRGFTFDFSIVLLMIALYYGGTGYGLITCIALLTCQAIALTFNNEFSFLWIVITYTITFAIILLLKHFLKDEFKTFPIIIICCLLIHLPLVYISGQGAASFLKNAILFSFYIGLVGLSVHFMLYYVKQHYGQVRLHQELALTDSLTGLNNRRVLENRVDYFKVHKSSFTVMMIDIDHFKLVNDQYGHDQGDKILSQISELLDYYTPQNGIVGRYGGEEFMILLPETDAQYIDKLAEIVRESSASKLYQVHQEEFIQITLSIGIFSCDPSSSISFSEVIKEADATLYEAKRRGRNQVYKAVQTHSSAL